LFGGYGRVLFFFLSKFYPPGGLKRIKLNIPQVECKSKCTNDVHNNGGFERPLKLDKSRNTIFSPLSVPLAPWPMR
jgi:hypothetical protein